MFTNNMINCLYSDLKAVQVTFQEGGKPYTYKTFDDYEIGDQCIVNSPSQGYVIVEVVGTDCTLLEANFRYKFIVQKIDDTVYKVLNEKEDLAIQALSRLVAEKRRQESIAALEEMLGGTDNLKLLASTLNLK